MLEKNPPRVQLDYLLKDKALDWKFEFFSAADSFANAHIQEQPAVEFQYHENSLMLKLSKNVLERLSMAEIVRHAELMQIELIGERVGTVKTIFEKSFVGPQYFGNLPDPE